MTEEERDLPIVQTEIKDRKGFGELDQAAELVSFKSDGGVSITVKTTHGSFTFKR